MTRFLKYLVLLYVFMRVSFVSSNVLPSSTCPVLYNSFLHDLQNTCHVNISWMPPMEIDGESLVEVLDSLPKDTFVAVLFHSSRCQFSQLVLPKFDELSAMFPQIKHLTVEQSSCTPSVFSRNRIYSLPSLVMMSRWAKEKHRGPKDLRSLISFYERNTGLKAAFPNHEVNINYYGDALTGEDPYLILAILFLTLKAVGHLCPWVVSSITLACASYFPRLNVGIFCETSQMVVRVLHAIDVKGAWDRLNACKTRRLNVRVWATSLASVSLGGTPVAGSSSPSRPRFDSN